MYIPYTGNRHCITIIHSAVLVALFSLPFKDKDSLLEAGGQFSLYFEQSKQQRSTKSPTQRQKHPLEGSDSSLIAIDRIDRESFSFDRCYWYF